MEDKTIESMVKKQEQRQPEVQGAKAGWSDYIQAFHRMAPTLWKARAVVLGGDLHLSLVGNDQTLKYTIPLRARHFYTPAGHIEIALDVMLSPFTDAEAAGIEAMKNGPDGSMTRLKKAMARHADTVVRKVTDGYTTTVNTAVQAKGNDVYVSSPVVPVPVTEKKQVDFARFKVGEKVRYGFPAWGGRCKPALC